MLTTLGVPQRRLLAGKRGRQVDSSEPEPVPTNRATVVAAQPFTSAQQASAWLRGVRTKQERGDSALTQALRQLNNAIRAHRAASGDPYAREVSAEHALVVRIGYGDGDALADGRFSEAWEMPRATARAKRSMQAREERFASLLGARSTPLAGEELVLRARADLNAARPREAALQARIALEALLAEMPAGPGDRRTELEAHRGPVGEAANQALRGDPSAERQQEVEASVAAMEASLRRLRLKG